MTTTLTAVAAHGLAGARVAPHEGEPLPDPEWQSVVTAVAAHGLGGLHADAVLQGTFPSTTEQRDAVVTSQLATMSGCLALESALLEALDVLAASDVEAIVLHGTAAAHLDYPDAGWRPFGDVDLLVRKEDLAAARVGLTRAGFGRQIELHTHAVPAFAKHVPEAELWRRPAELTLAGRNLRVLDRASRLVAACLKARTNGERRLIGARDVVQQVLGGADVHEVLDLARRWQTTNEVATAIDEAWQRFALADVVGLSVWAARNRSGPQLFRTRPPRPGVGRRWLVRR